MIPKIIHYCWFGGKKLPDSALKCIESWKKYCPDYEIKLWDETNFNIEENKFIAQAYKAKKFAFVSDYARFKVLMEDGGIYLDTDVELLKSLDDLLENEAFMGLEKVGNEITGIAPGLIIGTRPNKEFLSYMVNLYNGLDFCDEAGNIVAKTVVKYTTDYFVEQGFVLEDKTQKVGDVTIYSHEYFCPKDYESGKITITSNTYSVHHYDSTWWPAKALYYRKITEKYGEKKGLWIYRLTVLFNLKLWWKVINEK